MKTNAFRPAARTDVIVSELDGEALIYDFASARAHCVSDVAYRVFQRCDGKQAVSAIAAALLTTEDMVSQAVSELTGAGLLLAPAPVLRTNLARRRAIKQLAATAGLAVAVPMVWSIVAPTVAQAGSLPNGCSNPAPSCMGLPNGTCCTKSGGNGMCVNDSCV